MPEGDVDRGGDPAQLPGLIASSLAVGDATGWFEPLYAAAAQGAVAVPWDRGRPNPLLVEWAERGSLEGTGRSGLVVGAGLGADAEYLAQRGFATVAFDISPSAVRSARARHPASRVDYQVADLLAAPPHWRQAFDLVIESQTIQALPDPPRDSAITAIADFVAPGGTLLVLALARDEGEDPGQWPPWPITRREVDSFGRAGLTPVGVDLVADGAAELPGRRWRAEFRRPQDQPDPQRGQSPNSSTV